MACVLTWVRVGYFDEPDHLSGISHLIEHLLFKGTPTRGVGEIAKQTKAIGGYLNAATIYDYTYYYTVVPSGGLFTAIDIQADALSNPLFNSDEIEREKDVIVQELKRKYDSPDPYAWEKLLELAFEKHRIRRWRMGSEEGIRSLSRDSVVSYYNRYYVPENIILVVVGDFDPVPLYHEIEKRYVKMVPKALDRDPLPLESPQTQPKMTRLVGDISQALVKMGFHFPTLQDPDYYATMALNILLGKGRSSRLYRSLKEEKGIVDGIGTSLYASSDVGYFTVEAELKPEAIASCEEEVWVEIDRIHKDPPTEGEVFKVRNILEASFFAEKEEVMGQAYGLAYFEALGGYELAIDHINKMRCVTSQDIIRVAKKYARFSNMSLIEYVPKRIGEGASIEARLESLKKRVGKRVEEGGVNPLPIETKSIPPIVFNPCDDLEPKQDIEAIPLEGGVTLLYCRRRSLPLVSVAVYLPGGRLDETEQNCGITNFVLHSSLKGTENRTADELSYEMESLGSSIQVEAAADLFGYSMNVLSRDLDAGLTLLSDVILRPTFREREIDKERETILAGLQRLRDDMFRYPIELFYRALFGLHPYGLPRNGSSESISSLSRDQLLEWYSQVFAWRKMVVAIVGDVERQHAIDLALKHFLVSSDAEEISRAQIFPVVPERGVREQLESRDRRQTGVVIGFNGVSIKDHRFFPMEVLRNVLSGMGGRLFLSLRETLPLVYTVACFNISLLRGGAFFTYVATSPENEERALQRLLREFSKIKETLATEEEIRTAKIYSQGSFAMSLQTNLAVAYTHLYHLLAGRGIEAISQYPKRIAEVTAQDVKEAARELLNEEQYALGIVRGVLK